MLISVLEEMTAFLFLFDKFARFLFLFTFRVRLCTS